MASCPSLALEGKCEMEKSNCSEDEMDTLRDRLALLNEAVKRITENIDVEETLREVVDSARALTDAHYGVIASLKDTPRDYRVNWGPVGEEFPTWVDLSGNAFPTTSSYTIAGLTKSESYKVRVRARYDGYSGDWSEIAEAAIAPAPHRVAAVDTRITTSAPTDSLPFRAVGPLSLVSSQPGVLKVSWGAPDDPGPPHNLFTVGLRAAEHRRLEQTPGGNAVFRLPQQAFGADEDFRFSQQPNC